MTIKPKITAFLKRFSRRNRQFEMILALKKRIRKLELTHRQTESYLKNIIRVIPASIYWKDLNCVILGGNLAHAKLAGFSDPKEVIGKTEHDFAWKNHANEIIENDRLIMKSGVGCQLEEVGALSDGKLHTFLTSKDPLLDQDNNVIGIIGVSTDITEFKALQQELLRTQTLAAEAAVQAANAKAIAEEEMRKTIMVLVGDIVHDLRTPLTVIKSVTDFLEAVHPIMLDIIAESAQLGTTKNTLLNQNIWDYLSNQAPIAHIQDSIVMINEFINTTLNELACAHKAASSTLVRSDLTKNSSSRIIGNTIKAYPFSDYQRDILTYDVTDDFYFMGNSILMMKLLFNLIKNSFEQIDLNGSGNIFISTEKGDHYNLIRVKDTAGGAPPEVVSKFFNGYFTTKKNGTGIGLAFCKKTMLSFGGDIVCNAVDGESIEFILKFPTDLSRSSV